MAAILMSVKLATPGFLKIKVFWDEGYDGIVSVSDVTSKILSRVSHNIVDIGLREVIITSILYGFD